MACHFDGKQRRWSPQATGRGPDIGAAPDGRIGRTDVVAELHTGFIPANNEPGLSFGPCSQHMNDVHRNVLLRVGARRHVKEPPIDPFETSLGIGPSHEIVRIEANRTKLNGEPHTGSTQHDRVVVEEAHGRFTHAKERIVARRSPQARDQVACYVLTSRTMKSFLLSGVPWVVMAVLGCGGSGPIVSTLPSSGAARTASAPDTSPPAVASRPPNPPETPGLGPKVPGANPFAGLKLYVNPYNSATTQAAAWSTSRPADAQLLAKIGKQPTGWWIGDWSGEIVSAVDQLASAANSTGTVPLVIAYNIPNRDCGQYSAGGVKSVDEYRAWIHGFAKGAGSHRMIVILEPDALPLLSKCLSPSDQKARVAVLKEAVEILAASPGVSVYLDAGHAKWESSAVMAKRLLDAGLASADGFSLNVSNYVSTADNIAYGHAISDVVGGKHFIVDTGRNGNGPTRDLQWCNPPGRAIGELPTTETHDARVDAFVWAKPPGESDGMCNGGPQAGEFWPEQALGMASRAKW